MPTLQNLMPIDEDFSLPQTVDGLQSTQNAKAAACEKVGGSTGLYRTLLVEDDPQLLDLYGHILEQKKLQFDQCSDGHSALEKLSSTAYTLVITDLNLPGLDGVALLKWIQQHRPMTATVVISGDGRAERILDAMHGGAKDFLVKPFTLPDFQEMVDRWCQPQPPVNSEVISGMMKQVMHDVRGEVVNLEIMIKLLQKGSFGEIEDGVNGALLTMQEKLTQLKGVTADYCLLTRNLLQGSGDIPTERLGLRDEVLAPVLVEMQEGLQRKEIKVCLHQDLSVDGEAYVMGNRLMLKSVFRALFSNAIKHSRQTGRLTYGISSNGRRYKIHVSNEGDIVPADLQANIFDEFVQGKPDDLAASQAEGLGLGLALALAKDILRQHGGDIWYEPLANGSKFSCTLPLCPQGA